MTRPAGLLGVVGAAALVTTVYAVDILTVDDGTVVRFGITAKGEAQVRADGVEPGLKVVQAGSGSLLSLVDDTIPVVTVLDGGNVGIGTPSPGTALDLAGAHSFRGMSAPSVSPATQGRIYFDSGTNVFRVSENAGAYVDLVGAGGGGVGILPAVSSAPAPSAGFGKLYFMPDNDVALLLHFDRETGSTSFLDSSPSARPITTFGPSLQSPTQSKFGPTAFFSNKDSYLSIPHSPDIDFTSAKQTVELWWFPTSVATQKQGLFGAVQDQYGVNLQYNEQGAGHMHLFLGDGPNPTWEGGGLGFEGTTTLSNNTWYHMAVVKDGTNYKLFINGNLELDVTATVVWNTNDFRIGVPMLTSRTMYGYIDEFRILKGRAEYSANFTPPKAPHGVGGLLWLTPDGIKYRVKLIRQ